MLAPLPGIQRISLRPFCMQSRFSSIELQFFTFIFPAFLWITEHFTTCLWNFDPTNSTRAFCAHIKEILVPWPPYPKTYLPVYRDPITSQPFFPGAWDCSPRLHSEAQLLGAQASWVQYVFSVNMIYILRLGGNLIQIFLK